MAITILKPQRGKGQCGFCATGHHTRCAIGVKQERRPAYPHGSVYLCLCEEGGCTLGRRKCSYCGSHATDEIDPATWQCFDTEGCRAAVEARRMSDPLTRQLREIQEKVRMAKIEDTKEKAEKVAKSKPKTYCLVTGEETKGGLFKPGMDARYVSERVAEVVNAKYSKTSEKAARDKMDKDGVSDKLKAKFDKSLGLAKDKDAAKTKAAKEKEEAKG